MLLEKKEQDSLEDILDRLAQSDRAVINKLQGSYGLVWISTHWWDGDYKMADAEISINGATITEGISAPKYQLLPPKWKEHKNALRRQAEEILNTYGTPCCIKGNAKKRTSRIKGMRAIPASNLEKVHKMLESLADQYKKASDSLCSELGYSGLKTYLKDTYSGNPDAYAEVLKHLPTKNQLKDSIGLEWEVLPTALPSWALDNNSYHARAMQKTERALLSGNLASLITSPRQRLIGALDEVIHNLVDDSGKPVAKRRLQKRTFETLLEECDILLNFDDIVDDETLNNIRNVRFEIGGLVDMLNEQTANKQRLSINTDNKLVNAWASRLEELKNRLEDKEAVVKSMEKMCLSAGVNVCISGNT